MKRILIIIIVIVIAFLTFQAVTKKDEETVTNQSAQTNQPAPEKSEPTKSAIDTFADRIGATNKTEASFALIGARDGAKYTLNGKTVEIYQFDDDKITDGLKYLYDTDAEIRREGNVVFVFHDYPEDSPEVDAIMAQGK